MRQLQSSLILHDPLRHGRRVWIGHRNHINGTAKVFAAAGVTINLIDILIGHVVADDTDEDAQLLFHSGVQAGLNTRHNFERALHQSQSCTHRGLGVHVAHLDISHRTDAAALVHDVTEQLVQNSGRLFIWKREQRLAQRCACHVRVAPLTGHQRAQITRNTQSFCFQAGWQV